MTTALLTFLTPPPSCFLLRWISDGILRCSALRVLSPPLLDASSSGSWSLFPTLSSFGVTLVPFLYPLIVLCCNCTFSSS
ncbi:hypothetical protein OPV22_005865 [Ensete ventricosum]|uniref:Secreted peptide n=1 Tax=Ensete ventricosum TaxID=4639 RepID=A0AAV8RRS7_ENSVE|nr:hypothetical protein OPV22_005865 [Ensete ventricosum]